MKLAYTDNGEVYYMYDFVKNKRHDISKTTGEYLLVNGDYILQSSRGSNPAGLPPQSHYTKPGKDVYTDSI